MSNHDEVWDDSALLASWDEAAAEYKKYHSLAAKGEEIDISEVIAEPEVKPEVQPVPETDTAKRKRRRLEKQAADGVAAEPAVNREAPGAAAPAAASFSGAAIVPQALSSSVQDEGLKNLMMSWYYAGYYTGLYEGKQQAQNG